MDLLGGYSSSDDEPILQPLLIQKEKNKSCSNSVDFTSKVVLEKEKNDEASNVRGGKRKRLDISILPQHIQDLLTKGVVNDSDSDADDVMAISTNNAAAKGSFNLRKTNNDLIGMLPKPVSEESAYIPIYSAPSLPKVSAQFKAPNTSIVDDDNDEGERVEISNMNKLTSSETQHVNLQSSHVPTSSSIDLNTNSLPSFQFLKTKSAAPDVQPSLQFNEADYNYSRPQSVHMPQRGPITSTSSQQSFTKPFESSDEKLVEGRHSRKSEREIELSLLSGDLSKLGGAKIVEVTGKQPWNSSSYVERKTKEAEVLAQFVGGNKSSDKLMMQPSRIQSKRHQINSMAFQAAEAELALLDAKGSRTKSKSETKAKYGW